MCFRTYRLVGRDFQLCVRDLYIVRKLMINKIKLFAGFYIIPGVVQVSRHIHTKLIEFSGCFIMSLPSTMLYVLTVHEVGT
jgi:hypothetical protein